ncbi:unnamed protein product [Dracunculus medinensis]|uniref:Uncharacterized protein n=1 Tax=Dracunculus medinensis TaxID=318479 RepID=A0A0N4UBL4_DRAME|nr:unnamed protein product [Dracunculus medinensis]
MKIRRRIRPHELYWDAWFHQNGPIGTNAPTIVVDVDKESDFGFAQAMSYVQRFHKFYLRPKEQEEACEFTPCKHPRAMCCGKLSLTGDNGKFICQ